MSNDVVLSMRDISKTFPGVKALQHVDFTLRKGEIHALMGENGAGKSTLIKVLTGVHSLDGGEIRIAGSDAPIINKSPQDAQSSVAFLFIVCQSIRPNFLGSRPIKRFSATDRFGQRLTS